MNEFQTINVNLSNLSEEERKQLLELVKKATNRLKSVGGPKGMKNIIL